MLVLYGANEYRMTLCHFVLLDSGDYPPIKMKSLIWWQILIANKFLTFSAGQLPDKCRFCATPIRVPTKSENINFAQTGSSLKKAPRLP